MARSLRHEWEEDFTQPDVRNYQQMLRERYVPPLASGRSNILFPLITKRDERGTQMIVVTLHFMRTISMRRHLQFAALFVTSGLFTAGLLPTYAIAALHGGITALDCTQTGPNEYKLSYVFTGASHSVQISSSTHADGSVDIQPLLKTSDTTVTVHAGNPGQRMYFFLKTDTGEQREVSIRHLPLEGTPNFRDLGGYETTDGHYVKWGTLYRSGGLTYLTPADYNYLAQAGIRVVCDFRNHDEIEAAPETWIPEAKVEHLPLPIGGNSGKDRTGVFSALALLTLGVPEQTVLEDYTLTNQYLVPESPSTQKMMATTPLATIIHTLPPDQQKALMAADPEYLRSTLEAIRTKYGTFDNYRRTVLMVSDEQAAKLKEELLTK